MFLLDIVWRIQKSEVTNKSLTNQIYNIMFKLLNTTNHTFATMRLKNNGNTFEELFKFYRNDDVTDWKYMCRLIKGVPQVNNIIGVADNLRQLKREVKKWFDNL